MATNAIPKPRKAEKKRVKLKMAVQGPSGSGKTWGALALARNLWPQAKVCVIDTENESSELYADHFDFDTIPLSPPFTTARYVECIDVAVKAGYDVLIIDTITAQWDGEGGILRRKEDLERKSPGANGYALWARFTPEHEAFKQVILQSPIHVIATMRSKQEYALQTNEKGKQVPVKMGLAPIQRDQMDYEFTLVFDVGMTHIGTVSKDRTGLFNEKTVDLADPKTAEAIAAWLNSGKDAPPVGPALVQKLESSVALVTAVQSVAEPELHEGLPVAEFKVLDAVLGKSKKGTGYVQLIIAGEIEGSDNLFCYHGSLQNALICSKDRTAKFTWTRKGTWTYLEHLISVDDMMWDPTKNEFAE